MQSESFRIICDTFFLCAVFLTFWAVWLITTTGYKLTRSQVHNETTTEPEGDHTDHIGPHWQIRRRRRRTVAKTNGLRRHISVRFCCRLYCLFSHCFPVSFDFAYCCHWHFRLFVLFVIFIAVHLSSMSSSRLWSEKKKVVVRFGQIMASLW